MNIIVCIKQVPDTNEVRIDQEKGTLIRKGVPSIINPEDRNGLEEAIRIKEKNGAKITVISMGPSQAKVALREALAMGADEAILISDRAFAGSDTLATAYTLSQVIKEIGSYDLVFCGRQAIDGDTAQVGPQIAENLGIAQLTYVSELELSGEKVTAKRLLEDGYSKIESKLPLLVTVVADINQPRYPSIRGIVDAHRKLTVTEWSVSDFTVDDERLGLHGSPTKVFKTFVPTHEKQGEILEGSPSEIVAKLSEKLKLEHII
ncbi:electron transfer flavoprotein subunit beta [Iocasia frigidifontis]|uniref:Electron transfer flavoprotein small subunit n=1 Tax=Iocasia fonsfrigidae TaxID=2682810 RepID=A0A8A7KEP0_9FIRM|nr:MULTISPECIES: electron transfer flavoprotein subunit beta/FixA family protein [Halanaerobiaceae]AZO94429.1 electron transfer flavoprotein subunit beta/FixA family protein [Halocella sp. SP3-1]QTL97367.1 electron transfer flavoprotein subunit beta [Iocasia fonsfrigidae]